jgi:hypothetical protein
MNDAKSHFSGPEEIEEERTAAVIIRRSNGKEELVREVPDDFKAKDLLFTEDYFARLLWSKADIVDILEACGFADIKDNVDAVLHSIKKHGFGAFIDTHDGFAAIERAVKDAEQDLVTKQQLVEQKKPRKAEQIKKNDSYEK